MSLTKTTTDTNKAGSDEDMIYFIYDPVVLFGLCSKVPNSSAVELA